MKKSPRKLQLQTQTVAALTKDELAKVEGGGRSKTGNCPVMPPF
jgi:bacteriocin-like protein